MPVVIGVGALAWWDSVTGFLGEAGGQSNHRRGLAGRLSWPVPQRSPISLRTQPEAL